jgi:hypothetical protein
MVTPTRLNVTLYVHCLSCFNLLPSVTTIWRMRQHWRREVSQVLLGETPRKGLCCFIRYSQKVHNKETVSVGKAYAFSRPRISSPKLMIRNIRSRTKLPLFLSLCKMAGNAFAKCISGWIVNRRLSHTVTQMDHTWFAINVRHTVWTDTQELETEKYNNVGTIHFKMSIPLACNCPVFATHLKSDSTMSNIRIKFSGVIIC